MKVLVQVCWGSEVNFETYDFESEPLIGDTMILPDFTLGNFLEEYIITKRIHRWNESNKLSFLVCAERI